MTGTLRKNSIWSIIEVIASIISLFAIFKEIVWLLGVKQLGLWSLVLATTSFARLGDLGIGAGLSRYVALEASRGDISSAKKYVETAVIATSAFYVALALLVFWPLSIGLAKFTPIESTTEAASLLPFALCSYVLLNIANACSAGLIGLHRTDLKCKIAITGSILQVLVAATTIAQLGLYGVAAGQIAQYVITIVLNWLFFQNLATQTFKGIPRSFSVHHFKQLTSLGIKIQAASLLSFAFEPLIKFVMTAVAGLESLAIFEVSYRMVQQVRNIAAAPIQALGPAFVQAGRTSDRALADLYERAVANVLLFGTPLMLITALSSPAASVVIFGYVHGNFILFTAFLTVGWLANLISAPASILGVSRNHLGWNMLGAAVTSFAGPLAEWISGNTFGWGPVGGVAGLALVGLVLGGLPPLLGNPKGLGIRYASIGSDAIANARVLFDFTVAKFKNL